jgi:hypothetical protein
METKTMNLKKALLTSLGIFLGGLAFLMFGISIDNMWVGFLGLGIMLSSLLPIAIFFYHIAKKKFGALMKSSKREALNESLSPQNKNVPKKPFYKKWWFWIFVAYVLGFIQISIDYIKKGDFSSFFYGLFCSLFIFSLIGLIIGLKKPTKVIWWSSNGSKKQVLLTYGIATLIFFILFSIFAPFPKTEQVQKNTLTKTETTQSQKNEPLRQSGYVSKQSVNWTDNIPQWVKDKLTSEQLKEFINVINKSSPEFRQTFVSDYAKELAQQNKIIVLGVWAKSLGLSINYQTDDAWEIVEMIKRKTNDFAYYRDEIKFLEFIVTVTDKIEGQKEYQKFLENLLKNF